MLFDIYFQERIWGFVKHLVILFFCTVQNFDLCVCVFSSLFRSQKADPHNEGYILELDCCSSLDHLTDQKIIPEFIKKVSRAVRIQLNRFAEQSPGRQARGWLRAREAHPTARGGASATSAVALWAAPQQGSPSHTSLRQEVTLEQDGFPLPPRMVGP